MFHSLWFCLGLFNCLVISLSLEICAFCCSSILTNTASSQLFPLAEEFSTAYKTRIEKAVGNRNRKGQSIKYVCIKSVMG